MQADHDRQVDYVEFGATDLGRIKHFYQHVFDWRFEDYGPDYTSFQDGRLSGGVAEKAAGGPRGPPLLGFPPPPGEGGREGEGGGGGKGEHPPFFFRRRPVPLTPPRRA